jgi:hypothetical protein
MRFWVLYPLANSRGPAIADPKFEGIRSANDIIGGDDNYPPHSSRRFQTTAPRS